MGKRGRDHFVQFEDHTVLKHLILDKYVKQWAQKLLSWSPEVWFVDAFAGEGTDQHANAGSPIIAGRIGSDILRLRGVNSQGGAPMRILAIERDEGRCARLREAMHEFTGREPRIAEVRCGTLQTLLPRFAQHVGNRPVLFFLDPFGVDGLILRDLPALLSGPSNEVFALFSDVGARRLHATLKTPARDVDFEVSQTLAQKTLFPGLDEENVERKRTEVERYNRALQATQHAARRILGEALGEDGVEALRTTPDEDLLDQATGFWMQGLINAGAKYVYSLPVRDSRNAHVYQLVYATKSAAGLRAMKEAMQAALNSSSLPREVVEAIRDKLQVEPGGVIRELEERFRGREVRWTSDNDQEESVRHYLLEETPLLPTQVTEFKKTLEARGYVKGKRPYILRFPD